MIRTEKTKLIEDLTDKINNSAHIYLADISGLNAKDTGGLRRLCFEKNIELVVVKNTLFSKAMEKADKDFSEFEDSLKGPTSVMFSEIGNAPAKLIKEFRKGKEKPLLKAAFVEEGFFIGDNQLESLLTVKSKNELVADVMAMLLTPVRNVISSLQSGQNTIAGVVKTLSEK